MQVLNFFKAVKCKSGQYYGFDHSAAVSVKIKPLALSSNVKVSTKWFEKYWLE